ncbi:MAG: hypothetical protein J0L62_11020 [Bacteroidetes bacterium]|nr:hypothetical protein [Bacteroidota bacterium]
MRIGNFLPALFFFLVFQSGAIAQQKVSLSAHGLYELNPSVLNGFPNLVFSTHINSRLPVLQLDNKSFLINYPDRSSDPEYPNEQLNIYSKLLSLKIAPSDSGFLTYVQDSTENPGDFSGFQDTLIVKSRIERDLDYYQGDNTNYYTNWSEVTPGEGWIWTYLNKGATLSTILPSWVNKFTGTLAVKLRLRGVSRDNNANPDHLINVTWKGTTLERSFLGYNYISPDFTFPASASASRTLAVKSVGFTTTTVDRVLVDWIEITGKQVEPVDTIMVALNIPSALQQPGKLTLKVAAGRNYAIADSAGKKIRFPVVLSSTGTSKLIGFSLNGLSASGLFLVDLNTSVPLPVTSPVFYSGLIPGGDENLILITHPDFKTFADDYAAYRSDVTGKKSKVVTTEEIFYRYSALNPTPHAIKAYLQEEWKNNPELKNVMLIGNANWDHREITNKAGKKNFVPSYGNPVSDQWLVAFADTNKLFSFLDIGRLPINKQEDGYNFLNKVKKWEKQKLNDPQVKKFSFINGGFDAAEQRTFFNQTMRIVNDFVYDPTVLGRIDTVIKRTEGYQDAGKETPKIQKTFKDGISWLSFIGHAGSRTWDLMLSDVRELPVGNGLYPFITSMTCFTGDYANPSQESFSEDFVLNKDRGAIGFIGTSGLGYIDLDELLSRGFYSAALKGRNKQMGKAITVAKNELARKYKQNDRVRSIIRQYNLIGDPTLEFPIRNFPDLLVSTESKIEKISDSTFTFHVAIVNGGKVVPDTVIVTLSDEDASGSKIKSITKFPLQSSFLNVSLPVTVSEPGLHTVTASVAFSGVTDSLLENNQISFEVLIPKNDLSLFNLLPNQIISQDSYLLRLFYPGETELAWKIKNDQNQIVLSGSKLVQNLDSLSLSTSFLTPGSHYTIGFTHTGDTNTISVPFVTGAGNAGTQFFQPREVILPDLTKLSNSLVTVQTGTELISAGSAGFDAGNFGFITSGSKTVFCGFRGVLAARIDSLTLEIKESKEFDTYLNLTNADALDTWIKDRLNTNDYLVFTIKDEGSRSLSTGLKSTLRGLGSVYIDSVKIREAWAFGIKLGTQSVKIFEGYSRSRLDKVYAEKSVPFQPGLITMKMPSGGKNQLKSLSFTVTGQDSTWLKSSTTSPAELKSQGNHTITIQDADTVSILFKNSKFTTEPILIFNSVDYAPTFPSGLWGTKKSKSLLAVGEGFSVSTSMFQPFISDSAKSNLHLLFSKDNVTVFEFDTLVAKSHPILPVDFKVPANTIIDTGIYNFVVKIQSGDYFNDFVSVSDTVKVVVSTGVQEFNPKLVVTLNDRELNPAEKETVRKKAKFKFKIDPDGNIPLNDPTKVTISLNNEPQKAVDSLYVVYENGKNITVIDLETELSAGTIKMNIAVKTPFGDYVNNPKVFEYTLIVNENDGITQMANYPNPFESETRIYYLLTGLDDPQKVSVQIYTINGLKIKTISGSSALIGHNLTLWDGRDADGDEVANGLYLYKLIVDFGDKTITQTGKMLKVK